MPSQIKVDEIKNVAGQYKIKTNVFEGQTTAGSITVQGEGTNTTNLQQGLLKNFLNMNGEGTVAIRDSFNTASITDRAEGDYTTAFTTNFRAVEYSFNGNAAKATSESRNTGGITYDNYSSSGSGPQTSGYMFTLRQKSANANVDSAYLMTQVAGDLA